MSNVVNLNKFRKRRQRAERNDAAAGNRVRHGRSKSARDAEKSENSAQIRRLDGSVLDPKDDHGES